MKPKDIARSGKSSIAQAMIVAFIVGLASLVAAAEPSDDAKLSKVDKMAAVTNKSTRLQLELVSTEPVPVIGANHPDAKDIPAATASP